MKNLLKTNSTLLLNKKQLYLFEFTKKPEFEDKDDNLEDTNPPLRNLKIP